MAFFDGWGKKITETVDVVGKKTNELVEIQKLRSQISSLEKNIDKCYIELGKMMFEAFQDGEDICDEAKAYCEEITGSAVLIEEYKAEIVEIKGLKTCENCGEPVANDVVFCPKCGAKIEDIVVDAEVVDDEDSIFEEVVDEIKEEIEELVED